MENPSLKFRIASENKLPPAPCVKIKAGEVGSFCASSLLSETSGLLDMQLIGILVYSMVKVTWPMAIVTLVKTFSQYWEVVVVHICQ